MFSAMAVANAFAASPRLAFLLAAFLVLFLLLVLPTDSSSDPLDSFLDFFLFFSCWAFLDFACSSGVCIQPGCPFLPQHQQVLFFQYSIS
jgi:hypothetical protein